MFCWDGDDLPENKHIPLSGKVEKDKHLPKVPARDGGYARFFVWRLGNKACEKQYIVLYRYIS